MTSAVVHSSRRKPIKNLPSKIVVAVISLVTLVVFVYPLVYTIINSLKTYDEFVSTPQFSLPSKIYWGNYVTVAKNNFARYFLNSVMIAVLVVIFTVVFAVMAAFAISKLRFRGRKVLEIVFLLGLMIPYQVVLLPLFLTYSKLKLLNTYASLVIPQVAFGLPFSVQLFLAFFANYEDELIEAAIIDGCSVARAFISVVVPMCQNIIITIATLRAIFSWNEFIFSYTFISSRSQLTVVLGLNSFVGDEGAINWGPTFAAISVTVIPTLIAYMFLGKYMQAGLAEGAVKG